MMKLAKYKKFLVDRELYIQNKVFWKNTILNIRENNFEEWVVTKFANGEDFFDGNPIFSAFYPDLNKAIRIIQIPVEKEVPILRIWLDKIEYCNNQIEELAFIIQPTDNAYNSAINLITLFLNQRSIQNIIRIYNNFYRNRTSNSVTTLSNPSSSLSRLIKPLNEINHLNISRFRDKDLNMSDLKKVYNMARQRKRFLEKERSLITDKDSFNEAIDTIINLLTIDHKIDFKSELKPDIYIRLVEKEYGIDYYINTLHKTNSGLDALNKKHANNLNR